ncbi:MAG: two-component system sensor histidine kinase CreC [Gammaproteobacteria bacterium]
MTVRTRILLVFLLAMASGFFALERWLGLELRPRYYQSFEEPLVDMANILAEIAGQELAEAKPDFDRLQSAFDKVYQRNPQADIYGLRKENIDIRVYITDLDGIVIFDSYRQAVGEDFYYWRDVNLALHGEYGARSSPLTNDAPTRRDDKEARSIAYVAAPIYKGSELAGVLSVGKPKVNVTQFILTARRDLIWAVAGIALLALLTVTMLYLWISRPLYQVAQFAQQIAEGDSIATPNLGNNEIGTVANAIAAMREALDGKHYIEHYTQTLAHELKSPLTSIKASAELLLEDMSDEQRQRFIANIQTENERALNLIQRLLELAAVENRQGVIDKKNIPLEPLISEIKASLRPALVQKQLLLDITGATGGELAGERFLVKQALLNILENAIVFSPPGGQIGLNVLVDSAQIVIGVHDQGPGIPDFAREKIFDRFYSLPNPGNQKRSTGLGLNFVKEVMDLHHGVVTLTSDGSGTKAILAFPLPK